MSRRYPLEALSALRRGEADVAANRLVIAAAERSAAEHRVGERRRRREEAEAARERLEAEKRARGACSGVRAGELLSTARLERHLAAQIVERRRHEQLEAQRLQIAEDRHKAAAQSAEAALAARSAVEKHAVAWAAAVRRTREQSEEEDTCEAWSCGSPRRSSR